MITENYEYSDVYVTARFETVRASTGLTYDISAKSNYKQARPNYKTCIVTFWCASSMQIVTFAYHHIGAHSHG